MSAGVLDDADVDDDEDSAEVDPGAERGWDVGGNVGVKTEVGVGGGR